MSDQPPRPSVVFPYQPGPFDPQIAGHLVVGLIPSDAWFAEHAAELAAGVHPPAPPAEECMVTIGVAAIVGFPSALAPPGGQMPASAVSLKSLAMIPYATLIGAARATATG